MVRVNPDMKNQIKQDFSNGETMQAVKEKHSLTAQQILKYFTEWQEQQNGNLPDVHSRGRKEEPSDTDDQAQQNDEPAINTEPASPPMNDFLGGQVQKQNSDDEGFECGNCGFIMAKKQKFCSNCGVEFE